jgi:hypothetical protein
MRKNSKVIVDHLMEEILPNIEHEEPMLVLVGTLTIMWNRMNYHDVGAAYRDHVKRGDEYHDENVRSYILQALNVTGEYVVDTAAREICLKTLYETYLSLLSYFSGSEEDLVTDVLTMKTFDLMLVLNIDITEGLESYGQQLPHHVSQALATRVQELAQATEKVRRH